MIKDVIVGVGVGGILAYKQASKLEKKEVEKMDAYVKKNEITYEDFIKSYNSKDSDNHFNNYLETTENARPAVAKLIMKYNTKQMNKKATKNTGGLLTDDRVMYNEGNKVESKTRIRELGEKTYDILNLEAKAKEKEYYDKLRAEEYYKDKEAGVSMRELDRLYSSLSRYIKRKKQEEANKGIVDPEGERATKNTGGPMDDQMMMIMSAEPMESDNSMEQNYTNFIMEEALSEEEENMLMSKLEQDEELQMLFDKVIDVAQEFAGSGPVEGPGSGVSDSIPARLSDGEFVFTAKATEEIGADELMRMMKDAEATADERQPAQMGGVMDKDNPNPLGVEGSTLDNRKEDYTNPLLQPPIRGAGYGR